MGRFFFNSTKTTTTENRAAYPRIQTHKSALWLVCTFLFLVVSPPIFAFEENPSDSSEQLYFYDIKFEGANVHIDANYQYILSSFVEYLDANPELFIHIRGHVCCRAGKRISRRRARNVYRYLKRQGISKKRMTHAGYSNTIPLISPEKTDDDERKNRRVDFILSKKPIADK